MSISPASRDFNQVSTVAASVSTAPTHFPRQEAGAAGAASQGWTGLGAAWHAAVPGISFWLFCPTKPALFRAVNTPWLRPPAAAGSSLPPSTFMSPHEYANAS